MVYEPAVVLPFTFTLEEPRPSVPALLTLAAEPDDMESTCVKFLVFSGTAVMVFWSTSVPVDGAVLPMVQRQGTVSEVAPGSSVASRTGISETLTVTLSMRAVLKPSAAKVTA